MKKVYKYATGVEIPIGAIYLHTLAETKTATIGGGTHPNTATRNVLVWHYFLVEVYDN